MNQATVQNDNGRIQEILEKYALPKDVSKEITAIMQSETKHKHEGKSFYVHEENGVLVFTMVSVVKDKVHSLLKDQLSPFDVEKCITEIFQIFDSENSSTEIETITVPASFSGEYDAIVNYKLNKNDFPEYDEDEEDSDWIEIFDRVKKFIKRMKRVINENIPEFKVPIYDPSITKDGRLQFLPDKQPLKGLSYKRYEALAQENGLRIGTSDEWILFIGTIINRLVADGWKLPDAIKVVSSDLKSIIDLSSNFELTGSSPIAGKYDLVNFYKFVESEDPFYYVTGIHYEYISDPFGISEYEETDDYVTLIDAVPWFII